MLILVFTIAMLAAAGQSAPASDEQLAAWADAAQRAKASGNLLLAETEYRKIVGARPEMAEARSNLGVVQYLLGRYSDALVQFQQALRYKPDLYTPLLFSGMCHQKMRHYDKAVPMLEHALAARPSQSEVLLYLGLSYSGLGKEDRANLYFEKFAENSPKEIEAPYQLGGSYLRLSAASFEVAGSDRFLYARKEAEMGELQGGSGSAVRVRYEEAIALRPYYPNLHWALARVLLRNEDLEGARSAIDRELQVEPNHIPALLLKADLHGRAGEKSREAEALKAVAAIASAMPRTDSEFARLTVEEPLRALSLLNALLEFGHLPKESRIRSPGWPSPADLSQTIGALWAQVQTRPREDRMLELYCQARVERGELALARGQLTEILRRSPDWHMPGYLLGRVYQRLSLDSYTRMAALDPEDYRTHLLQAETFENRHYDSEAEQGYRAVLLRRPDIYGVHYRLGVLLLRNRQLGGAIQEFEKELELDPFHLQAKVGLAESYVEEHLLNKAIPLLNRTIEQDPQIPSAFLALARAYVIDNKPALAASMFERALKLDPKDANAHYQLAQTYQALGREKDAEREFAVVRRLRSQLRPQRTSGVER